MVRITIPDVKPPLSGSGPPTLEMVYSITEVPEPATLSLLMIGGLVMLRRRRFDPFDKLRTGVAHHGRK